MEVCQQRNGDKGSEAAGDYSERGFACLAQNSWDADNELKAWDEIEQQKAIPPSFPQTKEHDYERYIRKTPKSKRYHFGLAWRFDTPADWIHQISERQKSPDDEIQV